MVQCCAELAQVRSVLERVINELRPAVGLQATNDGHSAAHGGIGTGFA